METAKMEAGVRYGTCDGLMFVPEEPIHSNYAEIAEGGGTKIVELETDLQGKRTDPWGDCKPAKRTRAANIGVKGRLYRTFDRDGNTLEGDEGELTVVPARDIKGTWTDYLVLHGAAIRQAWERREQERLQDTLAEQLKEKLAGTLEVESERLSISVDTYRKDPPEFRISFKFEQPEVEEYVV